MSPTLFIPSLLGGQSRTLPPKSHDQDQDWNSNGDRASSKTLSMLWDSLAFNSAEVRKY